MSLHHSEQEPRKKRRITQKPLKRPEIEADDVMAIYKRDMGRFSLLSEAQERELIQAMNRGREAQRVLERQQNLPDDSELKQDLLNRVKGGKDAQNALISANLRLVFKVIDHYGFYGMPFADMVQEGNKGLIRAAEKYVLSHHTRYGSYAFNWVRQKIGLALPHQRDVISHTYLDYRILSRLKKARKILMDINPELEPNTEALLAEVNKRQPHVTREKVEYLREKLQAVIELEASSSRDWNEQLAESSGSPVERLVYQQLLFNMLQEVLNHLDQIDQRIIALYYGMETGESLTFREVTQILKEEYPALSDYQVRKRHKDALKVLEILAQDSGLAEMFHERPDEQE